MKTKLLSILSLVIAVLAASACDPFELNEHMEEAGWLVCGGEFNTQDSTTRRAYLVLMVKGINEDAYTINYTFDGKPGIGENALKAIDKETAVLVYNHQIFRGNEYMSEEMFSGQYEGDFPSGSSATLNFLNTGGNTHPNHGSTSFLAPKLEAGKHILDYTITNSYGDIFTGSRVFEIKDDPEKDKKENK